MKTSTNDLGAWLDEDEVAPSSFQETTDVESFLDEGDNTDVEAFLGPEEESVAAVEEPPVEPKSDEWLARDPNKEYGAILPIAKDKVTGEKSFAWPGIIRDAVKTFQLPGKVVKGEATEQEMLEGAPAIALSAALPIGKGTFSRGATPAPKIETPIVDEIPAPKPDIPLTANVAEDFLDAQPIKGTQESLAEVAMGARNPFNMTMEQTTANLDKIIPRRTAQDIQAEIDQIAIDTAAPGAKEQLSALQAEKAALLDPKVAIEQRVTAAGGKLSDEQFRTNIATPVRNALDSGASVETIRRELTESLSVSIKDEAYRKELIEQAIPEAYKQADELGKEVAQTYGGITPETSRGIIDVSTPDDGSIITPSSIEPIKLEGYTRSKLADSTNMLSLVSRQWARRKGINLGSKSLRELDDWTAARNLSQRGNILWKSIIGNPNGKDSGILWPAKGSELVPDTSVDNFSASMVKAREMGLGADEMREVMHVYNSYDDYANIDRMLAKADATITALKNGPDAKTKAVREEIKYWKGIQKDFKNKESFMSRDQMQAGIQKYQDNAAAQYFLNNKNQINKRLLGLMADSGRISKAEANTMLEAHPNYTPAWREVDDFTFANVEVHNSGGSSQPFKYRKISDKTNLQDPIAANANSIISTVRKIEQAQYRGQALNLVLKNATDDDFKVLFRESKAAVEKAIEAIRNGGKQRWSAEDIMPVTTGRTQKVGNITFDVDGGQIQLTITDSQLFQEFSQSRMWEGTNSWYERLVKLTNFKRGFIVLNPEFSARNFQRETMDAMVSAKTSFGQKLRYPISNVKNLFAKEANKELYQHITNNIGYGSTRGNNIISRMGSPGDETLTRALADEGVGKIVTEVAEGTYKEGLGSKVVGSLEALANRFDMAPRITLYEWMLRDGLKQGLDHAKAHEAAIFAARNLGVNFTQRGSVTGFDKALRVIPFARSFINATDRMASLGRYEPQRMARNMFLLYAGYKTVLTYNNQFKDENGNAYIDQLDPNVKKDILPIYGPWSEGVNDYFPMRLGWVYGRALPKMDTTAAYLMQEFGSKIDEGIQSEIPAILQGNKETQNIDPKEVYAAWTDYITGIVQPTSMLPPGAAESMALAQNRDFQGKPIVPEYLKDGPAWAQYNDQTPQVLVDFSYYLSQRGIEISPAASEYLLQSMFANASVWALQAGDMAYGAATGREVPEVEGRSLPFMGIVTGKTSAVPREGVEVQFSNLGKYLKGVNMEHQAILARTASDPNAYNDLQAFEIEHAPELAYYDEWKQISDSIKPLREGATAIAKARKDELQGYQTPENEIMGDPEKRKGIDKLRIAQVDTMKTFLKKIQTDPNAEDIWYERMTRNPLTMAVEGAFPSKKDNEVDLNDQTEYNSSSATDKESAMDYYKAPETNESFFSRQEEDVPLKKGFFEQQFPNINQGLDNMYKDKVLNKTLNFEGGYVNHPNDRGGPTNMGVTLATLKLARPGSTVEDLKNITKQDVIDIYDKLYWTGGKVDDIPRPLQDLIFDGNINHGVQGMTKVVQRALQDLGAPVEVDGKMGNATINALHQMPAEIIRKAIVKRRGSLFEHIIKKDPSQKVFKDGWFNRLTKLTPTPTDLSDA